MGSSGNFVAHSAKHSLPGLQTMEMATVQPPKETLDGAGTFHLNSRAAAGGRVNAGMPYKLYKDDTLTEQGHFDENGNMAFKHDMDKQSKYRVELPNGNRFAISSNPQIAQHEVSAGIGYHGYANSAGSLSEQHANLEQDLLIFNPASDDDDQAE